MRLYHRYIVLVLVVCTIALKVIVQPAHMPDHHQVAEQSSPYLSNNYGEALNPDIQTVRFAPDNHQIEFRAHWKGRVRYDLGCNLAHNMQMHCEGIAYLGMSVDHIESNEASYRFNWANPNAR